ncbi:MAG: hypothetical protein BWZ09_02792 [Alphaproteobacteria bacterium ADurb.BinA305]|nr:MAG: hypothetical protein BWZ09_02792 [Alphaproteobacteria bacterium ADurb.BinA305]
MASHSPKILPGFVSGRSLRCASLSGGIFSSGGFFPRLPFCPSGGFWPSGGF